MSKQVLSDLDFNSVARILNLPDPTSAQDPATKGYTDALVQGMAWKDNVRVASTATVTIASPGASIDGVSLSSGDRVLLKNQSSGAENGIYIWNGAAVPMTRSVDADSASELLNAVVSVDEGTANADTTWRQDAISITLGTTALSWVSFGTAAPSASTTVQGVIELATQGEVDTGSDTVRAVTPATLAGWSGRIRKFSQDIGNASATQFDVSHSFGTRDVTVEVYQNSGNYDTVLCDVKRTDTNTVRLNFASAPASNAYRVVIIG